MALFLSRWCAWNKQSGFASCLFNGRRDYEIPSASLLLARSVCQRHGLLKARKEPKDKEQYLHRRMCLNTLAYKKPNCFWSPSRFMYTTRTKCCRNQVYSDKQQKSPYVLAQNDLKNLYAEIRQLLAVSSDLKAICDYYFDGKGKAFRPMIVVLMAKACNLHHGKNGELLSSQHSIGMIVEMIHTASLVHDDVIDGSDTRRGKITVNKIWGERKAILAGDFVLSAASVALARLGNNTVVSIFTQAIEDLVRGEFMQLGSKENENERFGHYLEKTFKKTASLIANSCKAVSILGNCDPDVQEIAYQYGRNIGIAFQFPELHTLIMRRFSVDGDVDKAWQYVQQSDGVQQTCYLAHQYGQEAARHISMLRPSPERDALIQLAEIVLTRNK
ncbi:decaprenyl-diphosphate synthase subunit 1 isoform X2 [Hemiscyllium ocellatum]|uniref:decaprenyl-diphosphate synthase subunit 1 isoform X2 n=1 Tax=Hemiscyllium ocellatum TaxID=170820 RepID=UPI0029670F61|nr:decaprenyl-diphosphate synthase subunit 1 isoform X2 [Hemiscyllium ocellatum]